MKLEFHLTLQLLVLSLYSCSLKRHTHLFTGKKILLLSRLTVLEYLHTLTCREKFKESDKNALIYFKGHSEVNVKNFLFKIISPS